MANTAPLRRVLLWQINTSFNLRGEAMVNTPYDALETFYWSEMDALAMGGFLIDKEKS